MPVGIIVFLIGISLVVLLFGVGMLLSEGRCNPPDAFGYLFSVAGIALLWVCFSAIDERSEKITAHCMHNRDKIMHKTPDQLVDLDSTCIEIYKRYYASGVKKQSCGE